MFNSPPTHYSQEGRCVTNIICESSNPGLYVKVTLGNSPVRETAMIRENNPPTSNATLAFSSSDDSDVVRMCVTEETNRRTYRQTTRHRQIGSAMMSIKELLENCLEDVMCKAVADPIPDGHSWTDHMNTLSRAADGLFIWASTAVKFVSNNDDPFGKLDELVLNIRSLNGLDNLYATVLEQSGISWLDPKSVDRFRKVLGLVLLEKSLFRMLISITS
ncbi:uncharacterized protein FOMMEDRAFT_25886 [Fomitiporia mediterranea MF3/22]|uniref:uncharacterized protein n=1 Tax=Fomitiporia mediterranea (strain MF3/22) TaxID=694068 RepID=UPI0004407351|nr:uncharacterized protein FOMMEDRAFT_25886 [Fomitiporia mediterranea MF3/22]EJD06668.1 hypothetical protein FOMMEDRAFT_25886 [Fomitiporia mediterranea MF3/22]